MNIEIDTIKFDDKNCYMSLTENPTAMLTVDKSTVLISKILPTV